MADDMVESVESGVEAQVASATSGRVVENPGVGVREDVSARVDRRGRRWCAVAEPLQRWPR
jgi:hypothetical protein